MGTPPELSGRARGAACLLIVALAPSKPEVLKTGLARFQRGVSPQDHILALKQLALLLKAGVPLVQGIGTLKNQATHPVLGAAFADMEKRLRTGEDQS